MTGIPPYGMMPYVVVAPMGQQGAGVPPGGTTGQILAKKTSADYDTQWINPPSPSPSPSPSPTPTPAPSPTPVYVSEDGENTYVDENGNFYEPEN